jgi:hypothetical protein
MPESLDDYRWLVSEDAAPWLEDLASTTHPTVALVRRLRRQLSPDRTRLVLEQCQLRRRAAAKFDAAPRLFFTRQGLEQATDQWIARAKAQRFPAHQELVDLCCGVGGDLFALAEQGRVTGVDLDPIHALLATANADRLGLATCHAETGDARTWALDSCSAWHIDPDRRPGGRRTAQACRSEPSLEVILSRLNSRPHAALKLAPAADLPVACQTLCERQWLGSRRECRQQVAWFGTLAQHPARRTAMVVQREGHVSALLVGHDAPPSPVARRVMRFLHEPHACVLAAQLGPELAERFDLHAVDPRVAYLTGDDPINDLRMSTFQVTDVLPFDMRLLRDIVRSRSLGQLEVKKRGVDVDPDKVRRQLQGRGDASATLILTPHANAVLAVLAQRIQQPP